MALQVSKNIDGPAAAAAAPYSLLNLCVTTLALLLTTLLLLPKLNAIKPWSHFGQAPDYKVILHPTIWITRTLYNPEFELILRCRCLVESEKEAIPLHKVPQYYYKYHFMHLCGTINDTARTLSLVPTSSARILTLLPDETVLGASLEFSEYDASSQILKIDGASLNPENNPEIATAIKEIHNTLVRHFMWQQPKIAESQQAHVVPVHGKSPEPTKAVYYPPDHLAGSADYRVSKVWEVEFDFICSTGKKLDVPPHVQLVLLDEHPHPLREFYADLLVSFCGPAENSMATTLSQNRKSKEYFRSTTKIHHFDRNKNLITIGVSTGQGTSRPAANMKTPLQNLKEDILLEGLDDPLIL